MHRGGFLQKLVCLLAEFIALLRLFSYVKQRHAGMLYAVHVLQIQTGHNGKLA